jgi:hypothetical protein
MSGPNFFIGNNSWFSFYDSENQPLPNARCDGTPLRPYDTILDTRSGSIRQYQIYSPPGFEGWQSAGVLGNSNGDAVNFGEEVEFAVLDQQETATAHPSYSWKCLNAGNVVTKYCVTMNNNELLFKQGDVTGPTIMTFQANGNVLFANNVTVTGDLFADDVAYDETLVNILRVEDRIEHNGNATNKITFETDKMTLDASGTSIVLDDMAMTDKIVVTGQTKFVNNIDDVPDIYLQNHIHHSGDNNTRIGFSANDHIELRTGGSDRVLVTDASTAVSNTLTAPDITLTNYVTHTGDANTRIGFPANDEIALRTNGVDRINIISNGNVGIGISVPEVQLDVRGVNSEIQVVATTGNPTISLSNAEGAGARREFIATYNTAIAGGGRTELTSLDQGDNFTPISISSSGVRIGTTHASPTAGTILDVVGSAKVTTIRDTADSVGTAGQLLSSTGSALSWLSLSLGVAVLRETRPAGSNSNVQWPNPASNSLQKRQLNAISTNNLAITLSGTPNWTFTIPTAGTYYFDVIAQYTVGDYVSNTTISTRLLLNNNTLGLGSVLLGDSSRIFINSNVGFAFNSCNFSTSLKGIYTITGTTVFSLDQILTNAFAVCRGGFNTNMLGYEEVYVKMEISKLS